MYCIEIEVNGTWFPYNEKRFRDRSSAEAEAARLKASNPHREFAVVGVF